MGGFGWSGLSFFRDMVWSVEVCDGSCCDEVVCVNCKCEKE